MVRLDKGTGSKVPMLEVIRNYKMVKTGTMEFCFNPSYCTPPPSKFKIRQKNCKRNYREGRQISQSSLHIFFSQQFMNRKLTLIQKIKKSLKDGRMS